jgi:hypothetical protein
MNGAAAEWGPTALSRDLKYGRLLRGRLCATIYDSATVRSRNAIRYLT